MLLGIYAASGVLIFIAAILSLIRLSLGPTILDRAVALDVLTVVSLAAVALVSALSPRSEVGIFIILLGLTGFFSAVVVGRFVGERDSHENIKTGDNLE